jgi:hypothetical protein
MADEEVNVSTDEGAAENTEDSTEKKPGFFKSKLFLMVSGVIVILLVAGGVYYFLVAKQEPETESASDESVLESDLEPSSSEVQSDINEAEVFEYISEESEQTDPNANELQKTSNEFKLNPKQQQETQEKLIEAQKKADVLAEENLRMQQQITALKSQLNQKESVLSQQKDGNVIAPIREPNSVDYQQDFFDDSDIHQANQTPPPKPSWGEFERINNK